MFNTPGNGQWVQFKLPDAAAKIAEEAGAYKTRQNLFCGIYQTEARTVENVITLPPRIILVGEDGANIKHLVKPIWKVVEPWVLIPPVEAQILTLFADDGCIGIAEDLVPIDYKEDIPEKRRPDIHPKDLRRPILSPWEIAQRRVAEQHKRMSQGVDSPSPEEDKEEGDKENKEETVAEGESVQVRQPEDPPKNPEVGLNTGKRMKR